jgi:hypothetical protein
MFFHIINQHLNLLPVIAAGANHLGLNALVKFSLESKPLEKEITIWMAITADKNSAAAQSKADTAGAGKKAGGVSGPWLDGEKKRDALSCGGNRFTIGARPETLLAAAQELFDH